MNSKLFKWNLADFGKGLSLALLTAVLGFVVDLLKDKGFDLTAADLSAILQFAITTFIAYLSKNLFTNSKGKFGRAE